jgi:hypothetical protein
MLTNSKIIPHQQNSILLDQISNTATPTTNKKHMLEEAMHVVEEQEMGM